MKGWRNAGNKGFVLSAVSHRQEGSCQRGQDSKADFGRQRRFVGGELRNRGFPSAFANQRNLRGVYLGVINK